MKVTYDDINQYLKQNSQVARAVNINTEDIVFEERVKLQCFYCARYNASWRCPPKIPDINYNKILTEYENAAFIYVDMPITKESYSDVRTDSSVTLHKTILDVEKYLLSSGVALYSSYIGGSCKLCKNGCGKDQCNNPYLARIPLEATGVNVVASAKKYGINIEFPAKEHIIRIGLILW